MLLEGPIGGKGNVASINRKYASIGSEWGKMEIEFRSENVLYSHGKEKQVN